MTAMDWNDLASRPLADLGAGGMASSWNAPGATSTTAGSFVATAAAATIDPLFVGAQTVLGSSMTDRLWSSTTPRNNDTRTTDSTTTTPVPDISLEARLMQHQKALLEKILNDTAEQTRERTNALIEAQLSKEWEEDRERWRKEWLGPRGSAAQPQQQSPVTTQILTTDTTITPTTTTTPTTKLPLPAPLWPSHQPQPSAAPLNVAQAQSHLQVLQQMQQIDRGVAEFTRLTMQPAGRVFSSVESGYRSAWQWMKQMTGINSTTPVDQAIASLNHLCLQFQSAITDRNRQASLAGSQEATAAVYENDFANQCVTFAKLTLGLTTASSLHWPVLYFCLRSGHAVAALQVYEQSEQPNAAVLKVLGELAQAQGSAPCLWQARVLPQVSASDRRLIEDLAGHHREPPSSLYEQGVYALLSGLSSLPADPNLTGFGLIEDYLTGALWKALLQANPDGELEKLGQSLCELGPDYFGDADSGGWSFSWPLLLTQQYERAFTYLTEAGGPTGLLQATHLAYMLYIVGVTIRDLGSSKSSFDTNGLLASLLVSYAQQLLGHAALGPCAAMEYLVRIPDHRQARHEVAKLIAMTGQLEQLVGRVNADGVRVKGNATIDLHFSPQEVSQILGQAAELLLQGRDKDTQKIGLAAMCYMLAERYANVLLLLNQLLCPPEKPDEQRSFWLEQVDKFRSSYLTQHTHVVQVLEMEGKMGLVETSRILVELNSFFAQLKQERYEQAWTIVDGLQLLPKSRADLTAKEKAYYELDPLVQAAFSAFLVGVMEMLHYEYRRLKLERQVSTEDVVRERLKQIREQAKLLVTLAGLVGMVSGQLDKLARLESLLI